ncbi:MAG: Mu-like prophage major head subunit gpT family protein [Arcobacter sp.]|uniref:phage major capsid protein n=1 Tax=Arcobacter sp. TaxID=1872629 RepID=UPI003C74A380
MPKTKHKVVAAVQGQSFERKLNFNKPLVDIENRKVSFILISSNNDGERYDWWKEEIYTERLDVNGANYERLKTFFKDHNDSVDSAIGRVENIRVEDGQLKADVIFGTDEDSEKIFRKYVDGILTDCSIRYKINTVTVEERKDEPTLVTVTDFEIRELSAVGIGFDPGAVVGRNSQRKENDMPKELRKELEKLRTSVDALTAEQKSRMLELENLEKEEKRKADEDVDSNNRINTDAETSRASEIMDLVVSGQLTNERGAEFIKGKKSIHEVRKLIIEENVRNSQPAKVIVHGVPGMEDMRSAISDSLSMRCGVNIATPHADVNMFRNASLLDVARAITQYSGYDKMELAQRAMSSADFTLLLGNVANRVVAGAFEEQEGSYHRFTTNVDLPDFRTRNEVGLKNPNGRLRKINEKGEIKNIEFGENGESWKLESYGEKFLLTRQMIINDDLGVFTRIVDEFGKMSKRTANGLVYDLLQGKGDFLNYVMSDGKALFHADHKNLSLTGVALGSDPLSVARTAMRKQMDGKTPLNINPKYLIVSPDNETMAKKILTSESDIAASQSGVANPHKGGYELIVDAELDANPWYLAGARKTIKTGTLQGTNGMPIVKETAQGLSATEFECIFDFGLFAEDHRGLYKNLGA